MMKPCRLELNNSGAWKLLGLFDAAAEDSADCVLNAAADLAAALNDPSLTGGRAGLTLRVSTDESPPAVLMRWESVERGWRDARTGEAV